LDSNCTPPGAVVAFCGFWSRLFPLIQAGSLIEDGGGGLRANTIELIAHHSVALWW